MLLRSKHSGWTWEGKRTPFMGGGGGGGGAPSSQRVEQTSIPSYAQPYVENMLGQAAALTDISQNPYQVYGGQRIAGFTPMQAQAFQRTAGQQVAGQLGQATGLAGQIGAAGLGAGQAYGQMATSPESMQAYMSPYMQNVVDYQKSEAMRDYAKQIPAMQAQAVGQGAFGGNRMALQQAEAQRNLNKQLQGIQAAGSQDAFRQAQQAQQFQAGLGMQGLGLAGQAASTLGALGQTQFGQETAITDAIARSGALQQALRQQGLDVGYQDFLKQRNYPYQQLAFMSDMFRGLPLSQSAAQVYTAPPSMASQLGGLGMTGLGIYGMSGGFKGAKGGLMDAKAYKEGGKVSYAVGGDIKTMSTEELQSLLESPNLTPMEVALVEEQLMLRRRIENNPESSRILSGGIDTIPSGDMFEAAGGGIVAFAKGSKDAVQDKSAAYEDLLMEDIKRRQKALGEGSPYAQSEAEEAKIRASLAKSAETAPYRALAMAGLGTMSGTSQHPLSNLGLGGIEGLKSYAQAMREQEEGKKLLLQQAGEREKSKFARETALLGSQQTTLGQLLGRRSAAETAAAARADTATKNKQLDLTRAQTAYNALFNNNLDNLKDTAKPGGINYKKYKDDPNAMTRDARAAALAELSPELKNILGFPESKTQTPPAPPSAPARVPPKAAIQQLKNMNTPEAREQFDAIFGAGAAQRALGR